VPAHWKKYKTPRGISIGAFIADLKNRLSQLETIATDPTRRRGIWLGGLFQPEAYITATRQAIAHQKGWSLEQLVLSLDVEESAGAESFVVEGKQRNLERMTRKLMPGLKLAGATWSDGRLKLSDGQPVSLKASQITWTKREVETKKQEGVNLPVYLNGDRSDVLFSIDLDTDGVGQDVVAQRGLCLTAA
jgi:dynein heavy chain 1